MTAERRIIGETTLDFSYVYDDKGLLTRTVYPGDIVADYKYDSYGNRIAIIVDNDTVWKLKNIPVALHIMLSGGISHQKKYGAHRTGKFQNCLCTMVWKTFLHASCL